MPKRNDNMGSLSNPRKICCLQFRATFCLQVFIKLPYTFLSQDGQTEGFGMFHEQSEPWGDGGACGWLMVQKSQQKLLPLSDHIWSILTAVTKLPMLEGSENADLWWCWVIGSYYCHVNLGSVIQRLLNQLQPCNFFKIGQLLMSHPLFRPGQLFFGSANNLGIPSELGIDVGTMTVWSGMEHPTFLFFKGEGWRSLLFRWIGWSRWSATFFGQGTLDALKVKLAGHSKTIQLGLLRVSTNFSLGTSVTSAVFFIKKRGKGREA